MAQLDEIERSVCRGITGISGGRRQWHNSPYPAARCSVQDAGGQRAELLSNGLDHRRGECVRPAGIRTNPNRVLHLTLPTTQSLRPAARPQPRGGRSRIRAHAIYASPFQSKCLERIARFTRLHKPCRSNGEHVIGVGLVFGDLTPPGCPPERSRPRLTCREKGLRFKPRKFVSRDPGAKSKRPAQSDRREHEN
jgi:hypothetical protein